MLILVEQDALVAAAVDCNDQKWEGAFDTMRAAHEGNIAKIRQEHESEMSNTLDCLKLEQEASLNQKQNELRELRQKMTEKERALQQSVHNFEEFSKSHKQLQDKLDKRHNPLREDPSRTKKLRDEKLQAQTQNTLLIREKRLLNTQLTEQEKLMKSQKDELQEAKITIANLRSGDQEHSSSERPTEPTGNSGEARHEYTLPVIRLDSSNVVTSQDSSSASEPDPSLLNVETITDGLSNWHLK